MIHPPPQGGVSRIFVSPHEKRAEPATNEGPDRIEAAGSPTRVLALGGVPEISAAGRVTAPLKQGALARSFGSEVTSPAMTHR